MDSTFGARLRGLRRSKGLTQEKLASLCGMTSKTVQNYEASRHAPVNIGYIRKMAKALGVTVNYLLGDDKERYDLEQTPQQHAQDIIDEVTWLFGGKKLTDKEKSDLIRKIDHVYYTTVSAVNKNKEGD